MAKGKIVLDKQYVDLAEVVRGCVEALRVARPMGDRTLNLRTGPAWVHADPVRLEQIVDNLLVNALRYTPPGGRIDVDVHVEADDAVLAVVDSGIGISPGQLPHVFDAFVQGGPSIDGREGGPGIGLALVHRLATLHDGSVVAESAGTGKGSTFTVRLPLSANSAGAQPAAADSASDRKCSVLVIEDNPDGREMLLTILTLNGYQVLEACTGTDGLRIAAAESPAVAIVDIGLPGVDGYEVARRLRADSDTGGIGLVALTGYGRMEDRQRAADAGFDVHLVKPFDPDRLIEAINRCAGKR